MNNFDLRKYLAEGRLLKENDSPLETNWYKLNWDFSDSDSVDFRKFEVSIDQFKQASENGYVTDSDGVKRAIDKKTVEVILDDYEENWPED